MGAQRCFVDWARTLNKALCKYRVRQRSWRQKIFCILSYRVDPEPGRLKELLGVLRVSVGIGPSCCFSKPLERF